MMLYIPDSTPQTKITCAPCESPSSKFWENASVYKMRQRELVTGSELYQARRLSHIPNYADTCLQASAGQRWPLLDWPTYLQHTTYRAFSDLHTTVIVLLDVLANLDFRVSSVIQLLF